MHGWRGLNTDGDPSGASVKPKGKRDGWYVFTDTHLGLAPNREGIGVSGETCDPEQVGQFIRWLLDVKKLGGTKVKVSDTDYRPESRKRPVGVTLKEPSKLVMLGDMLDLWDSTDREAEFSSRPVFNLIEKLDCEKTYVIGNHDYELDSLIGKYPSGKNDLQLLEKPYYEPKRGKGQRSFAFAHGYEFEKGFNIGFWKRFSTIRSPAQAIGDYGNFLILPIVLGLLIVLGFDLGAWLSLLILTLYFESLCELPRLVSTEFTIWPIFFWNWLNRVTALDVNSGLIAFSVATLIVSVFVYMMSDRTGLSTAGVALLVVVSRDLWVSMSPYLNSVMGILPFAFLLAALSHFIFGKDFWTGRSIVVWFAAIFVTAFAVTQLALSPSSLLECISGYVPAILNPLTTLTEPAFGPPLFLVWFLLMLPALVFRCGIHLWRTFTSTRYRGAAPEPCADKWLANFVKENKLDSEAVNSLVVVYGHTHFLNQLPVKEKKSGVNVQFVNVPSWVKEPSRGGRSEHELRNTFLYIDPDGGKEPWLFLGWDSEKKRPFHIPFSIVDARRASGSGFLPTEEKPDRERFLGLLGIGWSPLMIAEWIGWRSCIASGRGIKKEVLFGDRAIVETKQRISENQEKEERKQIVMTSCCWKLAYREKIKNMTSCPNPACGKKPPRFKLEDEHTWYDKILTKWFSVYDEYKP